MSTSTKQETSERKPSAKINWAELSDDEDAGKEKQHHQQKDNKQNLDQNKGGDKNGKAGYADKEQGPRGPERFQQEMVATISSMKDEIVTLQISNAPEGTTKEEIQDFYKDIQFVEIVAAQTKHPGDFLVKLPSKAMAIKMVEKGSGKIRGKKFYLDLPRRKKDDQGKSGPKEFKEKGGWKAGGETPSDKGGKFKDKRPPDAELYYRVKESPATTSTPNNYTPPTQERNDKPGYMPRHPKPGSGYAYILKDGTSSAKNPNGDLSTPNSVKSPDMTPKDLKSDNYEEEKSQAKHLKMKNEKQEARKAEHFNRNPNSKGKGFYAWSTKDDGAENDINQASTSTKRKPQNVNIFEVLNQADESNN